MSLADTMATILTVGQLTDRDSWALDASLRIKHAETIRELAALAADTYERAEAIVACLTAAGELDVVDRLALGGLLADLKADAARYQGLAATAGGALVDFDEELTDDEFATYLEGLPEFDESEYAEVLEHLVAAENLSAVEAADALAEVCDGVRRLPFFRQRAADRIRELAPALRQQDIDGFEQFAAEFLDEDKDAAELAEHLYTVLDGIAWQALSTGDFERFDVVVAAAQKCHGVMRYLAQYSS